MKKNIATGLSTFYVILAILMLLGTERHWIFPVLSVFCLYIADKYNNLSNN
jgi:hypothetical protein